MPYNNTPIAPSSEVNGQVALPLARVQKIIAADPERTHVSKNASFAIALATEMFIQHLATTTHNVVKAERKPRRNIQYRDVSSAVAKTDNLEFLVDVVPKTITYKEYKKRQEGKKAAEKEKDKEKGKDGEVVNGQRQTKLTAAITGTIPKDGEETEDEADVSEGGIALPDDASTPAHNGHSHVKEDTLDETPEVMDVDEGPTPRDTKEDTEDPDEPDPAAMQIEMEMRGPRTNGTIQVMPRHTSGFTAINGSK